MREYAGEIGGLEVAGPAAYRVIFDGGIIDNIGFGDTDKDLNGARFLVLDGAAKGRWVYVAEYRVCHGGGYIELEAPIEGLEVGDKYVVVGW